MLVDKRERTPNGRYRLETIEDMPAKRSTVAEK